MKTTYLLLLAFCGLLFISSCTQAEEEVEILALNCEEVDGEFICDVDSSGVSTPKRLSQWCVYTSKGARGNDCPSPDPDEICIKCTKGKKCPEKVSLKLKGKDCRFRVKIIKKDCQRCPKGGFKGQFVK